MSTATDELVARTRAAFEARDGGTGGFELELERPGATLIAAAVSPKTFGDVVEVFLYADNTVRIEVEGYDGYRAVDIPAEAWRAIVAASSN